MTSLLFLLIDTTSRRVASFSKSVAYYCSTNSTRLFLARPSSVQGTITKGHRMSMRFYQKRGKTVGQGLKTDMFDYFKNCQPDPNFLAGCHESLYYHSLNRDVGLYYQAKVIMKRGTP
jgi:hypothetical protein